MINRNRSQVHRSEVQPATRTADEGSSLD